jgi:hypothetical protein
MSGRGIGGPIQTEMSGGNSKAAYMGALNIMGHSSYYNNTAPTQ